MSPMTVPFPRGCGWGLVGPSGRDVGGVWKRATPFSEHPAEQSTTTLANIGRGTQHQGVSPTCLSTSG